MGFGFIQQGVPDRQLIGRLPYLSSLTKAGGQKFLCVINKTLQSIFTSVLMPGELIRLNHADMFMVFITSFVCKIHFKACSTSFNTSASVVWADWIFTLALRVKPLKIQRSLHCQRLVPLLSSAFLPKLLDRRDCEDLTECSIYGILKRIKLFSPGTSSFPLSSHVRPLKVYKGAVK